MAFGEREWGRRGEWLNEMEQLTRIEGILLVEDHASFRQSLAYVLDREPTFGVIAQAGSLAEARAGMADMDGSVDIALVDLLLPDGNGIELIPELSGHGVPVVVLTILLDPGVQTRTIAAGAQEVLYKMASPEEILGAIKHHIRRLE